MKDYTQSFQMRSKLLFPAKTSLRHTSVSVCVPGDGCGGHARARPLRRPGDDLQETFRASCSQDEIPSRKISYENRTGELQVYVRDQKRLQRNGSSCASGTLFGKVILIININLKNVSVTDIKQTQRARFFLLNLAQSLKVKYHLHRNHQASGVPVWASSFQAGRGPRSKVNVTFPPDNTKHYPEGKAGCTH